MAVINYQNVGVTVDGTPLFANSASFSFQLPIEPVRSLGQRGAIANISNGPVEGSLSIDYTVTAEADPGYTIFQSIVNDGDFATTPVVIGGRSFNGYLTSHNLSAEANSIIKGTLNFSVYDPLTVEGMESSSAGTSTSSTIAHGSVSTVSTDAGAISFEYSSSVEWEPVYILGQSSADQVTFKSAKQTLNIKGHNIGKLVEQCPNPTQATANIKYGCGNDPEDLFAIEITDAVIQSSESSVQAGGYVQGSYELVKNY
jgi:hypothetical protein